MQSESIAQLQSGLETAFIDSTRSSNLAYKPQFVSNNYKEGRKVLSSIESELLACDEFSISVAWWDQLAGVERTKSAEKLGDIGRRGERLTMKYEERRTGKKPDWRSIETNLAGYDILSQISREKEDKVLIEVKTSVLDVGNAYAIISRHEWDVANLQNNRNRYLFYFWMLSGKINQLAIISVDEMSSQIPIDNELGKWESVSVPFSAYSDRFEKDITGLDD